MATKSVFKSRSTGVVLHMAVLLYFVFMGLSYVHGGVGYVRLAKGIGMVLLALHVFSLPIRHRFVLYIVFGSVVSHLVNGLVYSVSPLATTSAIVASAGVALTLLRTRDGDKVFGSLTLVAAVYFLSFPVKGLAPDLVFAQRSHNHISVVILSFVILYYCTRLKRTTDLSSVPALVALCVSVAALGRSGILSSLILVIGMLLLDNRRTLGLRIATVILIVALLFPLALSGAFGVLEGFFYKFRVKGLASDGRVAVASDYVNRLDVQELLIGFPVHITEELELTLHNSFLQWHQTMGVFALAMFGIVLIALVLAFKNDKYSFLFLVVLLSRGLTDTVLYPSGRFLDVPFLYILGKVLILPGHRKGYDIFQGSSNRSTASLQDKI